MSSWFHEVKFYSSLFSHSLNIMITVKTTVSWASPMCQELGKEPHLYPQLVSPPLLSREANPLYLTQEETLAQRGEVTHPGRQRR